MAMDSLWTSGLTWYLLPMASPRLFPYLSDRLRPPAVGARETPGHAAPAFKAGGEFMNPTPYNRGQEHDAPNRPSMTLATVIAILTVPVLLAIAVGCTLLRRAFARQELLPEEIALAAAWIFVVGSFVWLGVFLNGTTLLGFGSPWTWITAAHFTFAGYGALTVTALSCRVVSNRRALRTLRILLIAHPVAYLVTAAGLLGYRYCDEVAATSYALVFVTQLGAVVFGRPTRIARAPLLLVVFALAVPVATMVPALAWAWGRPIFDIPGMVRYHGIVNAIGHVGLGLSAFAWGRAQSHSVIHEGTHPTP
jgi:hypothetical protein